VNHPGKKKNIFRPKIKNFQGVGETRFVKRGSFTPGGERKKTVVRVNGSERGKSKRELRKVEKTVTKETLKKKDEGGS